MNVVIRDARFKNTKASYGSAFNFEQIGKFYLVNCNFTSDSFFESVDNFKASFKPIDNSLLNMTSNESMQAIIKYSKILQGQISLKGPFLPIPDGKLRETSFQSSIYYNS